MLRTRVALGLSLIAGFLLLAWLDSGCLYGPIFHVVVGAVMVCALMEFYALAEKGDYKPRKFLAAVLVACFVCCQYHLAASHDTPFVDHLGFDAGVVRGFYPFLALATAVGLCVLAVGQLLGRDPRRYLADASVASLGFLYVWFLGAHALAIRAWWGMGPVLAYLAAAKLGDSGAYFAGTLLGRHKFAPRASPSKTIEGAVGGLAASVGAAIVVGELLGLNDLEFGVGFWAVFGLVVGMAAQVGDLIESAVKRSVGAKDSAHLFPTFGGVLDVADSALLSAPVALWLIEFWGQRIK